MNPDITYQMCVIMTIWTPFLVFYDVFDYEDDDEIPIGCVYYDWYPIHDKDK